MHVCDMGCACRLLAGSVCRGMHMLGRVEVASWTRVCVKPCSPQQCDTSARSSGDKESWPMHVHVGVQFIAGVFVPAVAHMYIQCANGCTLPSAHSSCICGACACTHLFCKCVHVHAYGWVCSACARMCQSGGCLECVCRHALVQTVCTHAVGCTLCMCTCVCACVCACAKGCMHVCAVPVQAQHQGQGHPEGRETCRRGPWYALSVCTACLHALPMGS